MLSDCEANTLKLFKRFPCRKTFKKLGGYLSLLAVALAAALALATALALAAALALLLAPLARAAATTAARPAYLAHKIHSIYAVT